MKNKYTVNDGIVHIELTYKNGELWYALADSSDLPELQNCDFRWCLKKDRCTEYCFTHCRNDLGKWTTITLHRFLLKPGPSEQIDHINHNGLDNRRCNLRIVDGIQNSYNRLVQSNSLTGIPGLTWSKQKSKWRAELIYKKARIFEKYYDDYEQAKRDLDLVREAVTKVVFMKEASNL